jgi:hypothetical protein
MKIAIKTFSWVLLISIELLLSTPESRAMSNTDPGGLYVLLKANQVLEPKETEIPFAAGISVRTSWEHLQPHQDSTAVPILKSTGPTSEIPIDSRTSEMPRNNSPAPNSKPLQPSQR